MSRSHDLSLMEFLNIYKDKIMQKRKNKELEELLETGLHRNVKKHKNPPRVTVPKEKYRRKLIREAMEVITNVSIPSPETNEKITTKDLIEKGFTYDDVIKTANDIEQENIKNIKRQLVDNDGINIDRSYHYESAVETLHRYLYSFEI